MIPGESQHLPVLTGPKGKGVCVGGCVCFRVCACIGRGNVIIALNLLLLKYSFLYHQDSVHRINHLNFPWPGVISSVILYPLFLQPYAMPILLRPGLGWTKPVTSCHLFLRWIISFTCLHSEAKSIQSRLFSPGHVTVQSQWKSA